MSFVLDKIGAFVRREEVRYEPVELSSGLLARQVRSFKLDQLLRDFEKEVGISEVRFQIANQVYGRAFWNHSDVDVPVAIGQSLELFKRHKLLAEMQRAVALRSPYRLLVEALFQPEQFFDRVVKGVRR